MKSKLVLWGSGKDDRKLLVALELVPQENEVLLYTFSEDIVTELFYNRMLNEWRMGISLDFPEGFITHKRQLSASEEILPEDIKVERTDLIARVKTEWHIIVLSAKLYELYHSELKDLKEKIDALSSFDGALWEQLKGFWEKIQKQMREKSILREHVIELRNGTNQLFDVLKSLRCALDEDFRKVSHENAKTFLEKLEKINLKVNEGLGLQPLFENLKDIQKEFKDSELNRKDRSKVWKILDHTFKKIKEKKFGSPSRAMSNIDRIYKRYEGLVAAISKMEYSINRDHADRKFQDERIETTDGQLEMQIRQAKIKMIEERLNSKKVKLDDMLKTKFDLERRLEIEKEKEAKREEKNQIKLAEKESKDKISNQMHEASKAREKDEKKLNKAASDIKGAEKKPVVEAGSATLNLATDEGDHIVNTVADGVKDKIDKAVEADDQEE